jgi:hypothetical protein
MYPSLVTPAVLFIFVFFGFSVKSAYSKEKLKFLRLKEERKLISNGCDLRTLRGSYVFSKSFNDGVNSTAAGRVVFDGQGNGALYQTGYTNGTKEVLDGILGTYSISMNCSATVTWNSPENPDYDQTSLFVKADGSSFAYTPLRTARPSDVVYELLQNLSYTAVTQPLLLHSSNTSME